ncbi:dipeptide transport system permease DppB [Klebsiella michiganensis]|uniref:Dipeptide transport system permease DppB n=1 Tax=Klebsiella michiganensis TaxID=1134687 RepID=A0A7H4N375_9ENTR|nr:dipeptide transport system permease DppB [Klebsiella michiganensis]
MLNYVIKRLLGLIPTLLIVAVLVFLFVHMLPGDPARLIAGPEADAQVVGMVRQQLGLDRPLHVQFWHYISNIVQGDFGTSMASRRPVSSEIASRFMPTFWLTLASMSWAVIFGMAAGDRGGSLAQPLAGSPGNGAGGHRHLVPGVRARHAADAGLFR